ATGTVATSAGHDVPDITIVATDVPLDEDVRKSFVDGGAKAFVPYAPGGVAAKITVHVWDDPKATKVHDIVDVTLDFDGRASFRPNLFPADCSNVTGRVEVFEPVVGER